MLAQNPRKVEMGFFNHLTNCTFAVILQSPCPLAKSVLGKYINKIKFYKGSQKSPPFFPEVKITILILKSLFFFLLSFPISCSLGVSL